MKFVLPAFPFVLISREQTVQSVTRVTKPRRCQSISNNTILKPDTAKGPQIFCYQSSKVVGNKWIRKARIFDCILLNCTEQQSPESKVGKTVSKGNSKEFQMETFYVSRFATHFVVVLPFTPSLIILTSYFIQYICAAHWLVSL